ncbi:MAG TPA: aconitate hydratase AcnA [bacterium]
MTPGSTSGQDSFGSRDRLRAGGRDWTIWRLDALRRAGHDPARLPFSLRILLENLLRNEDGRTVTSADIEALASWDPKAEPAREIAFRPARVLLQDFTGVPAIVDLAAMRDAMAAFGADPGRINPLQPAELVIDHSVQVDAFGAEEALALNVKLEFERNRERYSFLRWGQRAFDNFRVVPPNTGIVHQVNLEHLGRVVFTDEAGAAYPDTLVGTDSHTTMINALGILGWGVGGIEAEAAMLGQSVSMLMPRVVGVRLRGELREGATATDLVLTVTELLRRHGVVGKFVEFHGPGLAGLTIADRATIANMSPEYGATCGLFPIDAETLRYLRFTGRPNERVALVEAYAKAQGLFHDPGAPDPAYSESLDLDLATVEPSVAGPKRPQDRLPLPAVKRSFLAFTRGDAPADAQAAAGNRTRWEWEGGNPDGEPGERRDAPTAAVEEDLRDGAVVIAAITSCTNTSNPSVMVAAGLLAKRARERGLRPKPWVKTSLAPGSKVVTEYLTQAGLLEPLAALGFHLVGYGCTTCIGNSGPLPADVSTAIAARKLTVCAVLSGNRNFEGRIHAEVKANYLMSPPLVVAYALAGRVDFDPEREPLAQDAEGRPVFLRDLWPSTRDVRDAIASCVRSDMFRRTYAKVFEGDERWNALAVPDGNRYAWAQDSTYIKQPPFFTDMPREAPDAVEDIRGARALALLGDSVTTDHISPAGGIKPNSPAGRYLIERGVEPSHFNSYGSRRGNHEVMMRGTFANVRLRNRLAPGTEGGWTRHLPGQDVLSIFDAAMRYQEAGVPLIVLAGKEYGSGSSRDWAAKGPALLGVRAVIAESFERIHRSNLIGMGVLPLEFMPGESAGALTLTGEETFDLAGLDAALRGGEGAPLRAQVLAAGPAGARRFDVRIRIDTPQELAYYRHGGILRYVLRELAGSAGKGSP